MDLAVVLGLHGGLPVRHGLGTVLGVGDVNIYLRKLYVFVLVLTPVSFVSALILALWVGEDSVAAKTATTVFILSGSLLVPLFMRWVKSRWRAMDGT